MNKYNFNILFFTVALIQVFVGHAAAVSVAKSFVRLSSSVPYYYVPSINRYVSYFDLYKYEEDYLQAQALVKVWDSKNQTELKRLLAGFRNHHQNVGIAESMIANWQDSHGPLVDDVIKRTSCEFQKEQIARALMDNWFIEHEDRFVRLVDSLCRYRLLEKKNSAIARLYSKAIRQGNPDVIAVFDVYKRAFFQFHDK